MPIKLNEDLGSDYYDDATSATTATKVIRNLQLHIFIKSFVANYRRTLNYHLHRFPHLIHRQCPKYSAGDAS